jgi:hypothetical protein
MSNIFITDIVGTSTYAIPTNDAELAAATSGFDTILSGVANLAYDRVLAWVEDQAGPNGAEGIRTLNCLVEKFTYLTKECPSETEVDTLGAAIEAALEADANITSIDQQQYHLFQAGAYFLWNRDASGGFLYPNTPTDDVAVGPFASPNGKWFDDGDLVLNGNTMSGTEVLRVSGSALIDSNGQLKIADSATIPPLNITERAAEPSAPAVGDIYLDDGTNSDSGAPTWRRLVSTGPDVWEDIGGGIGSTISFPGIQQTIFVDKGTTTGSEDGTVQNPYHTVGDALTAAAALTPAVDNKIAIVIYPGIYSENGLSSQDYVYLVGVNRDTCILQNDSTIMTFSTEETAVTNLQFLGTDTNPVISVSGAMTSQCEFNDCRFVMTRGNSGAAISVSSGGQVLFLNTTIEQLSSDVDALVADSNSGNVVEFDEVSVTGYLDIDGGTLTIYDSSILGQVDVGGTTAFSIGETLVRNPNDADAVILGTTGAVVISESTFRAPGLSGGSDRYMMRVTAQPSSCFICGTKFIWETAEPTYGVFSTFATFQFLGKGNGFQRGMNGNCRNTCISIRDVNPSAGTEYNLIPDAVTASQAGDVICLSADIHDVTDSVNITNDRVTLRGEGATIRALNATWVGGTTNNDALVNFGATDGTAPVDECEIRQIMLSVEPNIHGLQVNGGLDNRAVGIHVESTALKSSSRVGILFTDADAAQGERFVIQNCLVDSSSSATAWVDGVHCDGAATFAGQTFGYGNGITDALIQGNIVKFALETCYVFDTCVDSGVFVNRAADVCYNNGAIGLALVESSDCLCSGNSVKTNNNAASAAAIWVYGGSGCVVTANAIDGDGTAFPAGIELLNGADNNIVKDNTFRDCTNGIEIASGCDVNIVNPNQFISGVTTRIVDGDTSNQYVGTTRQGTGNPNGVVSGNFGDIYIETATTTRLICISYPVGTVWRVI